MASTAPANPAGSPGETEPEILLTSLTKRFGDVVAVDAFGRPETAVALAKRFFPPSLPAAA